MNNPSTWQSNAVRLQRVADVAQRYYGLVVASVVLHMVDGEQAFALTHFADMSAADMAILLRHLADELDTKGGY